MSISKIEVKDRGATPRGMRRVMGNAMKECWHETGVQFHATMSDDRFSQAHATKAGYAKRSKKYESRKFKKFGHTRPLEYSGTARRLVRTANIVATKNGVDVRYPGARVFNFKNPKSNVNMVEDFTKVLPEEATELAKFFDRLLDQKLNSDNVQN